MPQFRGLRSLKDKYVDIVKRNLENKTSLVPQAQPPIAEPQAQSPIAEPQAQPPVAEPMPLRSLWYSERTPKWNDALEKLRIEDKEAYFELEKLTDGVVKSPNERTDALARLQPASTSSKQIIARLKRWQSTLAAVRGIVMSVAALDPHKILPIICASAFFSIDILFNNMRPEERDKILDILFDCGNTIRENISFEMNFSQKSHPAIESDIFAVEDLLSDQYVRALRLVFDIQRSCKNVERSYKSRREKWEDWVKVSACGEHSQVKYTAWESDANEIKRQKAKWISMKKDLEDKLSADKHNVEVQKWIKKDGDPEPLIETIKRRVMPDGNYEDAAQWFLNTSQFRAWCDNFREPECPPAAKRVLWLRGTYGTGKTTLLYHTYAALKEEPEFHVGSRPVRIVPYFCDANKAGTIRPDYETVIRALIRRLSLLPDFTLAKLAHERHSPPNSTRDQRDDLDIGEWEDLFKELVEEGTDEYQFVFVVDALDECLNLRQVAKFLDFMSNKIMPLHPNVHLLCSSRQQVCVSDYFCEECRYEVEVTSVLTAPEMERFVTGEIARRRRTSKNSVFYKPKNTDLLENLKKTLLDHAREMFRWVQIWLDILLPALDDLKTIRKPETATEWLEKLRSDVTYEHSAEQQLEFGYQRLWDFNDILGYENQRIRLFRIVLAAFEPQAPKNLKEALRVQGSTYDQDLTTEDVKRLYSNFLYEDSDPWGFHKELRFVHESARKFILNMKHSDGSEEGDESEEDDEAQFSERKNHLAVAHLYIDVVGLSTHPFWQANALEPSNWAEILTTWPEADRLKQDFKERFFKKRFGDHPSFHAYLARYGLRHCALAARKRSLFDRVWSKVLDRVILEPVSTFVSTILAEEPVIFENESRLRTSISCVLGQSDGRIIVFPSHVLAFLNIIHEDDLARFQLPTERPYGSFEDQDRQRRLFEHASCMGKDFRPQPRFSEKEQTVTALQLACGSQNREAVDMILQATECRSSNSASSIIFTAGEYYDYPINLAMRKDEFSDTLSQYNIVETLLKFERRTSSMNSAGNSLAEPYISKQWSLESKQWFLESSVSCYCLPALQLAAEYFEEDQMSHLLSIARPENINISDWQGYSILHRTVRRGFLRLTRELIEEYNANMEAESKRGLTPPYMALESRNNELVEYFESRGAKFDLKTVNKDDGQFKLDLRGSSDLFLRSEWYPDPEM